MWRSVYRLRGCSNRRFADEGISVNAHASGESLETDMALSDPAKNLLTKAAESMKLSARGYYRLIRVSRTIADLRWSKWRYFRATRRRSTVL